MNCACVNFCGDVPEQDDEPNAVCKGLPEPPLGEPLQLRIVHRNADELSNER